MDLGNRIKELRNEKRLTQLELAKVLDLSESTISLYESGKREPDYLTISKIAIFFNVTTDYLLGMDSCISETPAPYTTGPEIELPPDLTEDERKQVEQFAQFIKSKRQASDEQAASGQ